MSGFSPPVWLKKAQAALLSVALQSRPNETQLPQPTQPRRTLRRWVWVVVVLGGVVVGGRLLFFEVEGNLLQWPLKARDWTGFGESYDNNVSVVTEKATEADGKTTKRIDKAITTETRLQPAKTLWDWASLLLAPATLAGLGFWFQSSQERAKRAQEQAAKAHDADQQRETALQDYFDYLSTLLVDKQLKQCLPPPTTQKEQAASASPQAVDATAVSTTPPAVQIDSDAALEVVKAKTLALFRLFDQAKPKDMPRKASALAFLGDTSLLASLDLDLMESHWVGAYLCRAQLSRANLFWANLSNADLRGANLEGAGLISANFSDANLLAANLTGANLTDANLTGANLWSAKLKGAILLGVDLSTTEGLVQAQLEGDDPPFLCKVKLPTRFTVDPQRDCAKLPAVLQERFPSVYKNLEAAEACVDVTVPPKEPPPST